MKIGLAAIAAAGMASAAHAATTYDTTLPDPPGVFFGTGNFNTGYAVDKNGGVIVGLKSKIRNDTTDSVQPVGNVYSFAGIPGQRINYDFAIIPASTDFLISSATISIFNMGTGNTVSVDALSLGTKPVDGVYEDSEQLGFFGTGFDFLHPTNDTFEVTLTATDVRGIVSSVTNVIKIGTGGAVPEPASWAMMILGVAGVGGVLRRKKAALAPATV